MKWRVGWATVRSLTLLRLRELWRAPATLFWSIGFPLVLAMGLGMAFPGTKAESRYIDFLIPGLIGMNLMMGSLYGIGWSLVDLRVRRLLQRLRASPVRPSQLLVAMALGRLVVIPLEVLLLLAFGHAVFGVQVVGSFGDLALIVFAGALAFAGIGVLLSARASTNESMSGLINLVTLPMLLGSGIFFSPAHFPAGLGEVLAMLPLSALNLGLRAVINDGASLFQLSQPLLILAGWAAVSFSTGSKLFRWC